MHACAGTCLAFHRIAGSQAFRRALNPTFVVRRSGVLCYAQANPQTGHLPDSDITLNFRRPQGISCGYNVVLDVNYT
jgi:hypothetical protein